MSCALDGKALQCPNTASGTFTFPALPAGAQSFVMVATNEADVSSTKTYDFMVRAGSLQAFYDDYSAHANFQWAFNVFKGSSSTALINNGNTGLSSGRISFNTIYYGPADATASNLHQHEPHGTELQDQ